MAHDKRDSYPENPVIPSENFLFIYGLPIQRDEEP